MIIGLDYHPSFQQIALLIEETGEYEERRLNHTDGEAELSTVTCNGEESAYG